MLPLAETAFLDILVFTIGSPTEVAKLKLLQQFYADFLKKKYARFFCAAQLTRHMSLTFPAARLQFTYFVFREIFFINGSEQVPPGFGTDVETASISRSK